MRWSDTFRRTPPRKPSGTRRRLSIENLEDRCLLSYVVTDLGVPAGDQVSHAYAVNNAGQVAGASGDSFSVPNPFEYSDGTIMSLGGFGGQSSGGAYGINDAGQVVGSSAYPTGKDAAFLYQNGILTDLGTFGGLDSQAFAINASSQIVGWADLPLTNVHRASLWHNGSIIDLGALGGEQYSMAFGINDAGQVTGESNYDGGNYLSYHAFLYSNGAMNDLGLLPGYEYGSVGAAINAGGLVVGSSYATYYEHVHGFLFDGTTLNDLGALPGDEDSQALGINSSGQVVGWSGSVYPKVHHAFLYQDGVMIDLNSQIRPGAGWTLTDATAINDAGQIAGYGINPAGQTHAFLLTPTDFGAAPPPVRMDPLSAQALSVRPLAVATSAAAAQPDGARTAALKVDFSGQPVAPAPAADTQPIASAHASIADRGHSGGSIAGVDDPSGLWMKLW